MPSFKVAHIREQGQSMLLFPLDSSFGHKTEQDQRAILEELGCSDDLGIPMVSEF